ncbi:M23 family metallopeptidase [Paenibacillus tianjinensis]|uniref:M23 family metallopeptidase n=2 Tax=Paenibacillus tianjinensis TaxID=2810347 RepID=A0ABX7LHR5_9BACL|nr:M23 family metallopeptidase [Paenibacillus tianjinensis]
MELSEEAESIRDQLKSVDALEAQLQSLINPDGSTGRDTDSETDPVSTSMSTPGPLSGMLPAADTAASSARNYGVAFGAEPEPAAASSSLSAVSFRLGAVSSAFNSTVVPQVGGEYIAVYQDDPLELVQETRDDYAEIRSLLEEMVTSITTTITEAKEAKSAEAQLQATKALAEKKRLAPAVIWPTHSKMITSSFGYRSDPFEGVSAYHSGIDIAGSIGDPVYAAMDGEVTASEQMGARGKYIILKHSNGLETWYMHLNGMTVSVGDKVNKGQQIGTLGNTGRSTGPHLHFQVVKQNKAVNPLGYVKP